MTNIMDKRIVRSKAAIKETFLQLLHKKPFQQISISEIVKKANYNRGTFYANFVSKEDLLEEVINDVLAELIRQIRKPYEQNHRVDLKQLQPEDITLFHYLKEQSALYRLLLSDHIQVDFRHKIAEAIENLFIQEYVYEVKDTQSLQLKSLYTYRAYGIAGLVIRWIEEDFPTSPLFMAKQVIELNYVSTEVFHVKNSYMM